eukprot:3977830-Prymnesium_polylepis.1
MWRDKRTGTVLAPGAVQNWPTSNEEKEMSRERMKLQREEAQMLALARKLAGGLGAFLEVHDTTEHSSIHIQHTTKVCMSIHFMVRGRLHTRAPTPRVWERVQLYPVRGVFWDGSGVVPAVGAAPGRRDTPNQLYTYCSHQIRTVNPNCEQ